MNIKRNSDKRRTHLMYDPGSAARGEFHVVVDQESGELAMWQVGGDGQEYWVTLSPENKEAVLRSILQDANTFRYLIIKALRNPMCQNILVAAQDCMSAVAMDPPLKPNG